MLKPEIWNHKLNNKEQNSLVSEQNQRENIFKIPIIKRFGLMILSVFVLLPRFDEAHRPAGVPDLVLSS